MGRCRNGGTFRWRPFAFCFQKFGGTYPRGWCDYGPWCLQAELSVCYFNAQSRMGEVWLLVRCNRVRFWFRI